MILHVIPDSDDPYAMMAKVMDALPPGSYLMDLVEPGVVRVEEWRPDHDAEGKSALWCALGRKR